MRSIGRAFWLTLLMVTFLALLAVSVVQVAAWQAANAALDGPQQRCRDYTSTDIGVITTPVVLPSHPTGQKLAFRVTVAYPFCTHEKGRDKASPRVVQASWWVRDGRRATCRYFDGLRVNVYIWDQRGHNVNPPQFFVPCRESEENGNTKVIHKREWLKRYNHDPQWRANVEAVYDLRPNDHRTVGDTLSPLPDIWPLVVLP